MSGKTIRTIVVTVLLALAMTAPALMKIAPSPAQATTPATIMVEEHGTTAS
ncbi:MAG: hypothetical protein JW730_14215 [Anaerolineales bacterium]|nr:hypothetical protein [Anaerolineales bacterium]